MTTNEVEHEIEIAAEGKEVYRLLADVENWPLIFPPSVYVDRVEHTENTERIRIWALAQGEPKNWTSRRELDPDALRIVFRQEVPAEPVRAMEGTWIIEPTPAGSRVRLLHSYSAVDDDPDKLEWIDKAVETNSRSELASLKRNIELVVDADLTLSFTDSLEIEGRAKDAYDFINEAQEWSERLPHVASVDLREETPGLQLLRMDTLTKDGNKHTTESVRVCFPDVKIAYKQTTLPALMTVHTGYWLFEERADGTTEATSQHTVVINTENIAAVLGEDADVAQARTFVREALGNNSRATLRHAKEYAEARRS
ncbi:cyclase [Saccharomonospora sp. CUA-673]|uniref:aromatase/cyclase n=1 Tax=Saccharomonospora sp. CUA-673 TaxID=1904969 RepID=UPI00096A0CF3|nr:aromatase/cyclase [Saccharomonospora sp. CUA-673]OLT48987.1 cyclase [Saccharomonospora sp. CUA-673]